MTRRLAAPERRRAHAARTLIWRASEWTRRDSNPRATGYEPAALTAELQVRVHRNPRVRRHAGQCRMLTARAATSSTVIADAPDWIIIRSFAVIERGIASVGLNAIEFVYET